MTCYTSLVEPTTTEAPMPTTQIIACGATWTDGNGYGHRCDRLPHDPDGVHCENSHEISAADCALGGYGEADCSSLGRHAHGRGCVLYVRPIKDTVTVCEYHDCSCQGTEHDGVEV